MAATPVSDESKRPSRPGRTARRKARKHALDVLFEADVRGVAANEVLRQRIEVERRDLPEYAQLLVHGVTEHAAMIDETIMSYAEGWDLGRMPAVDRNILRLGVFEMQYVEDVPDVVAIDEAVALAAELSTDDSPRYVNGVLGRLQLLS